MNRIKQHKAFFIALTLPFLLNIPTFAGEMSSVFAPEQDVWGETIRTAFIVVAIIGGLFAGFKYFKNLEARQKERQENLIKSKEKRAKIEAQIVKVQEFRDFMNTKHIELYGLYNHIYNKDTVKSYANTGLKDKSKFFSEWNSTIDEIERTFISYTSYLDENIFDSYRKYINEANKIDNFYVGNDFITLNTNYASDDNAIDYFIMQRTKCFRDAFKVHEKSINTKLQQMFEQQQYLDAEIASLL